MTGADVHAARRTLGEMWGLGRPLHRSELARSLRLAGRDPGRMVGEWGNQGADRPGLRRDRDDARRLAAAGSVGGHSAVTEGEARTRLGYHS